MKPNVQPIVHSHGSRHHAVSRPPYWMQFAICEFQPTEADVFGHSSNSSHIENLSKRLRSFRNLSKDFQEKEGPQHFWIESTLFVVITLLSAWPIWLMATALSDFLGA